MATILNISRIAVGKLQSALDRPKSLMDIRSLPLQIEGDLSYNERCVIRDYSWILADNCKVVFDIGASVGLYAGSFARIQSIEHVVAFEPLTEVFSVLTANIGADPKVTCINCALGMEGGTMNFHRNRFSPASSFLEISETHEALFPGTAATTSVTVQLGRLDEVIEDHHLPQPDLIKIDVQGYEDRVIQGGTDTLRRTRYCVVEVCLVPLYEGMAQFQDVVSLFASLGFEYAGSLDQLVQSGRPIAMDAVFANRKLETASTHQRI